MSNYWKQPIPTDIINRLDFISRHVFLEILLMVRNEPCTVTVQQKDKNYTVCLERGQCIFKIKTVANNLKISRKKVKSVLKMINEGYTELTTKGTPIGTIITLTQYDSLVSMNVEKNNKGNNQISNEGATRVQRGYNECTPNKNVECKNEEKDVSSPEISISEKREQGTENREQENDVFRDTGLHDKEQKAKLTPQIVASRLGYNDKLVGGEQVLTDFIFNDRDLFAVRTTLKLYKEKINSKGIANNKSLQYTKMGKRIYERLQDEDFIKLIDGMVERKMTYPLDTFLDKWDLAKYNEEVLNGK